MRRNWQEMGPKLRSHQMALASAHGLVHRTGCGWTLLAAPSPAQVRSSSAASAAVA
jgi:hypothetical protein